MTDYYIELKKCGTFTPDLTIDDLHLAGEKSLFYLEAIMFFIGLADSEDLHNTEGDNIRAQLRNIRELAQMLINFAHGCFDRVEGRRVDLERLLVLLQKERPSFDLNSFILELNQNIAKNKAEKAKKNE